jgi:hypothetical protein
MSIALATFACGRLTSVCGERTYLVIAGLVMVGQRSMVTPMAGQQPGRPHLLWIAEVVGLPAGQIDQPFLGHCGDCRLFGGSWTVVQRRQSAAAGGPLGAALHGLMNPRQANVPPRIRTGHPDKPTECAPARPARRFYSRSRHRDQLRHLFFSNGQLDHKPWRCHDARPRSTYPLNEATQHRRPKDSR